ncbi:hypothetical protein CKO25_15215 [Thiocapsa imhoffii]|uniref:Uncharacterized protein n=1 Tax=Thiocapsa imhoffii TaxID=382777 RepID=A0A9X0WJQ3_9GAMM|nr:hypothetical protein [Thiocapsa imhoffii]
MVLNLVDLLGFGPTVRKVYRNPHSESLTFFAILAACNSIVVMALEHESVATVLFLATIAIVCLLLLFLIVSRRRVLAAA